MVDHGDCCMDVTVLTCVLLAVVLQALSLIIAAFTLAISMIISGLPLLSSIHVELNANYNAAGEH